MNTSLSQDLHRWAKEETDELKKNRLRFAAARASQMEVQLDQATRIDTSLETLRMHLVKSLEMLGPKESA